MFYQIARNNQYCITYVNLMASVSPGERDIQARRLSNSDWLTMSRAQHEARQGISQFIDHVTLIG
jgi:hypothetical protein